MGWLWSTPNPPITSKAPSHNHIIPEDPLEPSPEPPSSTTESSRSTSNPPPIREPTPDELAEEDLRAFIDSLSSPSAPPTPSAPKYRSNLTSQPPPSPSIAGPSAPINPSLLYPSTMSCRAAFDSAFYCQSLGGQFNNVYRYGGMRDCSANWGQFWFCMRTNRSGIGEEERAKRVRQHYWQREEKYRRGESSEDVWVARDRMLEEGSEEGRFDGDLEAVEAEEERAREDGGRWGGDGRGDEAVGKELGRGARRSLYGE